MPPIYLSLALDFSKAAYIVRLETFQMNHIINNTACSKNNHINVFMQTVYGSGIYHHRNPVPIPRTMNNLITKLFSWTAKALQTAAPVFSVLWGMIVTNLGDRAP